MGKVIVSIDWEDSYGAWLEILPGCVAVNQSLADVKKDIRTSIEMHLESMRKYGEEVPAVFNGEYELYFELNAQALLKAAQPIVTQAALSRATGINQQQLSHYSTGLRRPRSAQRTRIINGLHRLGKELLAVE